MKFTKKEIEALVLNQASVDGKYTIKSNYLYYPLTNNEGNCKIAAALIMTHISENKSYTSVLATTAKDEWYVKCGDMFLEGIMDNEEADAKIIEAINSLPEQNQERVSEYLNAGFGIIKESSGCTNARLMANLKAKRNNGETIEDISLSSSSILCGHIKNMFAQMDSFDSVSRELSKMLKDINTVSRMHKSDSAIVDALENYGFQGEAAFIAGPGGHGKTHTVKEYAQENDLAFIELQGHGQIEAIDMYGYDKKVGDQLVWFDGPISQAARLAASGTKTLLFIDEFVNIPMRETAGLKASFEPYKGFYYFQTSRVASVVDGIASMEEIKVPVENLQIVAAANIGSGYASEEVDKALKQRFMFLHYEATDEKVRKVLTSICKERGFNLSLVNNLMNFKALLELKVKEGELEEAPTMRHLSRKFLGLMKSEDQLEDVAQAQILQFVEFDVDGKPVAEQVEIVEEAIEATLAI